MNRAFAVGITLAVAVAAGAPLTAAASPSDAPGVDVSSYWTPERRDAAVPRDIVVDDHGQSFVRTAEGFAPYGRVGASLARAPHETTVTAVPVHSSAHVEAFPSVPQSGDTSGPTIAGMDPAANDTIGSSHEFTATVSDVSGIKSVRFAVTSPTGTTSTFSPALVATDTWRITLTGFTDGAWTWQVTAKDRARPGNTVVSPNTPFSVTTSGGSDLVVHAPWTTGGQVSTAAGRIYFEMPANNRQSKWSGYVCSGTTVTDTSSDRSIIQTAAHCAYDDVHKAFARNILFIPDQAASGTPTDLNCDNDRFGCWVPAFAVVDDDWASRTWPDNIPWDYAYYVVSTTGAHRGTATPSQSLEETTGTITIAVQNPSTGALTAGIGYSYSSDPQLMFCQESLALFDSANWWLPSCGLTGGSSGGPWLQPVAAGNGELVSVNSWGYTTRPGMAGPRLVGTSAPCVFGAAISTPLVTSPGALATC